MATFEYGLYWIGFGKVPAVHVEKRLLTPGRGTHFLGDWDADDFFVTLAQKLGCFPPRFVTNPFSHLRSIFSMLQTYKAPRNDPEDERDFRQGRFDVAAVVRQQLDNLIARQEAALPAEYYFLAGEYDRVITLFERRPLKSLTAQEQESYGRSRMIVGSRLHAAATVEDDIKLYRIAAKHFELAARISLTETGALYNWGNVLFDLSLASRHGAPEVMTRSAEAFLRRAVRKYQAAIAKEPAFADAHNNIANALSDLARAEHPPNEGEMREAFVHYEAALRTTEAPGVVHNNYAKSLHYLARATNDLELFKRSMKHFKSSERANPSYYSLYLSWGHALADRARRTSSVRDYQNAFEKYKRAAELDPADTAALHSWYYTLLEAAKRSKGMRRVTLLEQAELVSKDQKNRRRQGKRLRVRALTPA